VKAGETIRLVPSARQAAVNPHPHDLSTLGHIGDRIRSRFGESAAGRARGVRDDDPLAAPDYSSWSFLLAEKPRYALAVNVQPHSRSAFR